MSGFSSITASRNKKPTQEQEKQTIRLPSLGYFHHNHPSFSGPIMATPLALLYNQTVFHRSDTLDAAGNLSRLGDTPGRIDKTAQLNFPFERLDIDLEHFQGRFVHDCGFYLRRDRRVIDILAGTLARRRGCAPQECDDQRDADQETQHAKSFFHDALSFCLEFRRGWRISPPPV